MEEANKADINKNRIPKWIVLQLLEKCNLRCGMCYEWGQNGSYHEKQDLCRLDVPAIKKVVEMCQPARPYYELFGGEPLMYLQIGEVIAFIREHGSSVDVATNGVLLEKKAESLVEAGLSRLWVSMDGPEEINDSQRGKNTYKSAIEGLRKVCEIRKDNDTRVGVTTIVTPGNYRFIEEFFFELIGKCSIDHISIEFQTYSTREQYFEYRKFLKEMFDIDEAGAAKGYVHSPGDFEGIDAKELEKQMKSIKEYCGKNNIQLFNNPNTIDAGNYKNYFLGRWELMSDRRTRCSFPWIHAEISAKGDVAMCHTFHDLTFGNINNENFIDIWNSPKSRKFRSILKTRLLPVCTACSRYYTHA